MTLAELLHAEAAAVGAVERVDTPRGIEWQRGGFAFAGLAGARAEFRLPPNVRRAALGTPDTAASDRRPEWIAFTPPELDRMAADRARAWFGSAWRHAAD